MKKEEEQKKKEGQKKTAEQKQKEKQEQMKRKAEEKIAQQEAMKDPDRTFFSKSERIGTLILDILKLTVVFSLSLLITAIPWFVGKEDGPLPTYKFNDVNETNLCYWFGDTGLLDVKNPCKYRGYTSRDSEGSKCLPWKNVVERHSSQYDAASKEGQMIALISSSSFATEYPDDYGAPVCRRLAKRNPLNKPFCFIRNPKGPNKPPVLGKCWIVPCTLVVSNKCYGQLAKNYGEF